MDIPHIPVLYNETLDAFKDINDGYIIDCTTGYAGHSSGLLEQNENINLICNDQDEEALLFSKKIDLNLIKQEFYSTKETLNMF